MSCVDMLSTDSNLQLDTQCLSRGKLPNPRSHHFSHVPGLISTAFFSQERRVGRPVSFPVCIWNSAHTQRWLSEWREYSEQRSFSNGDHHFLTSNDGGSGGVGAPTRSDAGPWAWAATVTVQMVLLVLKGNIIPVKTSSKWQNHLMLKVWQWCPRGDILQMIVSGLAAKSKWWHFECGDSVQCESLFEWDKDFEKENEKVKRNVKIEKKSCRWNRPYIHCVSRQLQKMGYCAEPSLTSKAARRQ